jgi:hypothetical protein
LAPPQKPLVPNGFAFGSLALVFRVNLLTEVPAVRKVEGHRLGVEAAFEACDFTAEGTDHLLEVGGDCDQILSPIQLSLVNLAGAVRKEVCVDSKVGISDSLPSFGPFWLRRREGL